MSIKEIRRSVAVRPNRSRSRASPAGAGGGGGGDTAGPTRGMPNAMLTGCPASRLPPT
ncbi:hypothetical protein GCM10023081_23850 [Arthrobacter ginkgonis]|uniref:Uncharacterized protein n=1 Tax=Arthrobacter ginkgonis TaxID=1630594 RepID=A0ABP7CDS1_9MICC